MYGFLSELHRRPAPFSVHTTDVLWTRSHLAARMLELHLSQETPLGSRPLPVVDRTVAWLDRKLGLAGKALCDLGCGPGLYAERFARRGARVTGVDFSANSIAYARKNGSGEVSYREADYLADPLPGEQDIVTLIYCDLCPLSPGRRNALFAQVRTSLKPGGLFVFDVVSETAFAVVEEGSRFGRRYMDGFWSAEDYFAFHQTFRYPEERLALDRFTIVEESGTWEVFNWMQYYTPGSLRAELAANGFEMIETAPGFDGEDTTFAVLAKPTV